MEKNDASPDRLTTIGTQAKVTDMIKALESDDIEREHFETVGFISETQLVKTVCLSSPDKRAIDFDDGLILQFAF